MVGVTLGLLAFYVLPGERIPGWLRISAIPVVVISCTTIVLAALQLRNHR